MRLLAVGRLRTGPEAELYARYAARLRPPLSLTEVPEARGSVAEIRRRESASLLAALPANGRAIPLDLGGATLTSEALAELLRRWLASGREPCFLIGGAEGHDAAVLARADAVLSLGSLTWPHKLARVMLTEQLFRAQAILAGHPYHRGARPRV